MNNIKDLKNIKPNLIMDVVSCDIAKLQIDEIGSTLIVKAKVSPDSAFSQIEIYDDNDDVEVVEIIKGGMYTIDVAGYNVIKLECGNDIKGVISLKTENVINGQSGEGGESIIVDSFLSDTSTHAVQNKVITEAFNNKQDVLSFDTTPTEGSSNPVTSGGIKSALDLKADKTETIGKSGTGTNSEIFNDYENNVALGINSHIEGYKNKDSRKAFRITAKDSVAKTYTLSSVAGLKINDGVYVNSSLTYLPFGKITQIDVDNLVITVDSFKDCNINDYLYTPDINIGDTDIGIAGSHVEGGQNMANGPYSHSEGYFTIASGLTSHTEGLQTTASAYTAHAEGFQTIASGCGGHAEGAITTASGDGSHTEGQRTIASGQSSHAEGQGTIASGPLSHVEGYNTISAGQSQHVEGEYNIEDTDIDSDDHGKYIHIVGNGKSNKTRSNAHTLDWQGNAWYQGNIKIGGASYEDDNAKVVLTENDIIKTAEGDSISVTDFAKNVNLVNYQVYGNSTQATRSGKNLLSSNTTTSTLNGVTLTYDNGTITLNGTCTTSANFDLNNIVLSAGTYTLSANANKVPVSNSYAFVQLYDTTNNQTITLKNSEALGSTTITISFDGTFLYRIRINEGTTYDNFVFKPQLELGSTATEYEQYGVMPSPDYPSEIQSVGDLVTDETSEYYGKYDVPVIVTGKNLIPYPYYFSTKTINGVTFTDNGDGSITIDGTATANAVFYLVNKQDNYTLDKCGLKIGDRYTISKTLISGDSIANVYFTANYNDKNGSMKQGTLASSANTATSKIQSDFKSWAIYLLVAKDKTVNNTTIKLQLEKGSSATEYEPYRGIETTHIYLDEPLRKVGDYADYVDWGNQKVVRQVKEFTLTNTGVSFTKENDTYKSGFISNTNFRINTLGVIAQSAILCDKLPYIYNTQMNLNSASIGFGGNDNFIYVCIAKEQSENIDTLLEGAKCYMPLVTSTEEPITVPELTAPNSDVMNINVNTQISISNIYIKYYSPYYQEMVQGIDGWVRKQLLGYQTKLTFDTVPTTDSINPVTSNGIKTALDLKVDKTETIGKSGTGTNAEIFNDYTNNTATAQYSHTEGTENTAKGKYAHAEGKGCIAGQDPTERDHLGSGAHAEGRSTKALHNYTHAEGAYTEVHSAMSHAEGNTTKVLENAHNSHAEGCQTEVSGTSSHAEGHITFAGPNKIPSEHQESSGGSGGSGGSGSGGSGEISNTPLGVHSEGLYTYATQTGAHAEGVDTWSLGYGSHSEGEKTEARGYVAHAEGAGSVASGSCSHAEGQNTQTIGENSHTEGQGTIANGFDSHAEGLFTIASGQYQHVEGQFNIEDTADKYVHIVGNGNGNTSSANYKSNAHTLDWNGNAWFQGNIKIGGTSYDDENAQTLVTQRVLNNYAKVINTSVVVSTTDWISLTDTNGATYYKKTIEVANVIEDGQSTIDVELPTEDIAAARLQKEAYQCIDQCIVNTGNIVLYCYELIPAVSFTLKIQILY